jgi:hypothetical protein
MVKELYEQISSRVLLARNAVSCYGRILTMFEDGGSIDI